MVTSNGHWTLTQLQLQALLCETYIDIFAEVIDKGKGAVIANAAEAIPRRDFIVGVIQDVLDPDFEWPEALDLTVRRYTNEQRQTEGILLRPTEMVFSWSDHPNHQDAIPPTLPRLDTTLDDNFIRGTLIRDVFDEYVELIYKPAQGNALLASFYQNNQDVVRRLLAHALCGRNPLPANLNVRVDRNAVTYSIHYDPTPAVPQHEWTLILPMRSSVDGGIDGLSAVGCDQPCEKP